MTLRMSEKRTFGAASRSSPSLRWNSSRYSSGTRPTSRNDITWPSFIAAPFIVPSAETICWAASMWRRSSAFCLPSSPRARLVVAVPSWRAAWPAARPVTRAVREMREVGMRSLAMINVAEGRELRAPGRRNPHYGVGAGVALGGGCGGRVRGGGDRGGRGRAWSDGVADALGVGVGVWPAFGVAVGVGVGVGVELLRPPKNVVLLPDDVESPNVSSPAVTTTAAIAERDQRR